MRPQKLLNLTMLPYLFILKYDPRWIVAPYNGGGIPHAGLLKHEPLVFLGNRLRFRRPARTCNLGICVGASLFESRESVLTLGSRVARIIVFIECPARSTLRALIERRTLPGAMCCSGGAMRTWRREHRRWSDLRR